MRVAVVVPDFADNSTGRAFSLWLVMQDLGWRSTFVSTVANDLWGPLRDTSFARACRTGDSGIAAVRDAVRWADLVVAVKPFPASLGAAAEAARLEVRPLVADIDDPDLEAVFTWERPVRRVAREVLRRPQVQGARAARRTLRGLPTIASNPALALGYGASVVPHVRLDPGAGSAPDARTGPPRVAFVGTNRPHKGVDVLRRSLAALNTEGYSLDITAPEPADARPWERWLGETGFEAGLQVVRDADVVAIPSLSTVFSRGQFPVKVVDAMLAARLVVASDLPPIRWAVGDTALLVRPGSVADLTAALSRASDPALRRELGARARERALRMFTPSAVAPALRVVGEAAVQRAR